MSRLMGDNFHPLGDNQAVLFDSLTHKGTLYTHTRIYEHSTCMLSYVHACTHTDARIHTYLSLRVSMVYVQGRYKQSRALYKGEGSYVASLGELYRVVPILPLCYTKPRSPLVRCWSFPLSLQPPSTSFPATGTQWLEPSY